MSINRFYTDSINVRRLRTTSGYKKEYSSTATVEVHFQAITREARAENGIGLEENAYSCYFDEDKDIKKGDFVTDGLKYYKVLEVTNYNYSFGINKHKVAIMVEYNE